MIQHPYRHIKRWLALCMLLVISIWIVVPAVHFHHEDDYTSQNSASHDVKDCLVCLHWATSYENGFDTAVTLFFPLLISIFLAKPVSPIIDTVTGFVRLRAPPVL